MHFNRSLLRALVKGTSARLFSYYLSKNERYNFSGTV
jgi:hypothetical protein